MEEMPNMMYGQGISLVPLVGSGSLQKKQKPALMIPAFVTMLLCLSLLLNFQQTFTNSQDGQIQILVC